MTKPDATTRHNVINVVPEFVGKTPSKGHKKFLDEYVKDFNKANAAVRAGHTKKWSESCGSRLVREFKDYVDWKMSIVAVENAQRVSLDQEGILREMELLATANIQDYFTMSTVEVPAENAKSKPKKVKLRRWKHPEELTREQAAAVKRVAMNAQGEVTDYVLYDKDSNLFSLGRHLGMFSEKVILEHRHKHLHAKIDLSGMPLDKLLSLEQEFVQYIPKHERQAS